MRIMKLNLVFGSTVFFVGTDVGCVFVHFISKIMNQLPSVSDTHIKLLDPYWICFRF